MRFVQRFPRFRNHALWALIEDDRSKTSINVTYNDCIQGVRHILWDEYSIFLNPTLTVVAEYSIDSMENAISHPTYGWQEKLTLRTSENEVLVEDKHLQILYSIFFECFNLNTIDEKKVNDKITQQYMKPEINLLLLSDISYRINRITFNDDGTLYYDASKILASLDSDEKMTILDRKYIDMIFLDLVEKGILFYGIIKNGDEHLKKWKEFGRVN